MRLCGPSHISHVLQGAVLKPDVERFDHLGSVLFPIYVDSGSVSARSIAYLYIGDILSTDGEGLGTGGLKVFPDCVIYGIPFYSFQEYSIGEITGMIEEAERALLEARRK